MNLLKGNVKLVITFWLFAVVPGVIYRIIGMVFEKYYIKLILIPHMHWLLYLYIIFPFIYFPLIYIAIWKSSNQYTKNKLWPRLAKCTVILGVFFLIIGALLILNQFKHRNDIPYKIKQEVTLISKSLPIKVDAESEIVNVTFINNILSYDYKLTNKEISKLNLPFFSVIMKPELLKIVCNNPGLKTYLLNGIRIDYNYVDKNEKQIGNIIIQSNDCL